MPVWVLSKQRSRNWYLNSREEKKPKGEEEMKTEMKIKQYHLRFSFVLLLMILLHLCICGAASAKKSNSMISGDQCNATIAECLAGEEELMESETTRRFLAFNDPKIVYNSLKAGSAVCNTRVYHDCIPSVNKSKRSCATYNRCKRSPKWIDEAKIAWFVEQCGMGNFMPLCSSWLIFLVLWS